jgi:prepilin-type N-terminal cleavage/methylation domain-containing protein
MVVRDARASVVRLLGGFSVSQPARDSGYTLIEVLVTITLMGILMAFAVSGWSTWARASEQSGTARELQTVLRSTHQRAVTEGNAMCVQFDTTAGTYTVYRGTCVSPGPKVDGPLRTNGAAVHLAAPAFTGTTATTGVTFYARGTATPGSVQVTRNGSSKVYTLSVEGLTGRVSLS